MPHSVPRQQICTVIWGSGVFQKKKVYKDANQTENFIRAKTGNDSCYREWKELLTLKKTILLALLGWIFLS